MSSFSKALYRIGVALAGDWAPNCPEYPFHFTEPKAGDRVWVITLDTHTQELKIEPDTIADVTDHSEYGKDKELPPESYLIDFWLETYSPGHGVNFGTEIFRSFDEAAFVLLQCYCENYEEYLGCITEIKNWRQEYDVQGFFDG